MIAFHGGSLLVFFFEHLASKYGTDGKWIFSAFAGWMEG
jgi:hypothetical protein